MKKSLISLEIYSQFWQYNPLSFHDDPGDADPFPLNAVAGGHEHGGLPVFCSLEGWAWDFHRDREALAVKTLEDNQYCSTLWMMNTDQFLICPSDLPVVLSSSTGWRTCQLCWPGHCSEWWLGGRSRGQSQEDRCNLKVSLYQELLIHQYKLPIWIGFNGPAI